MNRVVELLKAFIIRFLNVLAVSLVLGLGLVVMLVNGVFITNIANSLRLTGYIDPSVGIQFVLVVVSLVWIPLFVFKAVSRR